MQKMYLNMKACRGAILEKKNRRRNRAAIRVQTVARRRQAKKIVDQKFAERDAEREKLKQQYIYEQARNIQRVYRGFVDRQFVNAKLEQRAKFKKLRGGKEEEEEEEEVNDGPFSTYYVCDIIHTNFFLKFYFRKNFICVFLLAVSKYTLLIRKLRYFL